MLVKNNIAKKSIYLVLNLPIIAQSIRHYRVQSIYVDVWIQAEISYSNRAREGEVTICQRVPSRHVEHVIDCTREHM